jgi:hypothetical protein
MKSDKMSDISGLKTTNTFLYHNFNQYDGMPISGVGSYGSTTAKQPPDMDPEMLRLLKENQIKLGVYEKSEKDKEDPGIYTVPVFPNQPIHPESEISKKIQEQREIDESKVCIENIERIYDELNEPEQGIPCADTIVEIGEMDILSLNKLFAIPEFLVIRNIKREQNELIKFNSAYAPDEYAAELHHDNDNLHSVEESKKELTEDQQDKQSHRFDSNELEKQPTANGEIQNNTE